VGGVGGRPPRIGRAADAPRPERARTGFVSTETKLLTPPWPSDASRARATVRRSLAKTANALAELLRPHRVLVEHPAKALLVELDALGRLARGLWVEPSDQFGPAPCRARRAIAARSSERSQPASASISPTLRNEAPMTTVSMAVALVIGVDRVHGDDAGIGIGGVRAAPRLDVPVENATDERRDQERLPRRRRRSPGRARR